MLERILVPLRTHDRLRDVLPYLELIARPQMEVVFLLQCDDNRYPWWLEHVSTVPTRLQRSASIATLEKAVAQHQRVFIAEDLVVAARKILDVKGTVVHVEFYSGSIKKITKSYQAKNKELTILVNTKVSHPQRLLMTLRQLFGRAAPQPLPAMLLLQATRHV